ncbi:MAG: mutL [Cyanobacteria bacterium RYN_339]|nr:mutL [Cyanobacteria bacterium RYN_339]
MSKIQRLPIHVANQIAAGEVIERPASVVKELVENALDAGATRITVEVGQGGRDLRVTDDGEGMNEEDARLAFERFATSKLRDAEELWNLATMGFRGEALASIAAIARVECVTRPRGGDRGSKITIHGGAEPIVKPAGCPEGTSIQVADLFFNTPARVKFLRAAATEQGHINDVLAGLALCHPAVDFRLLVNDREVLSTVGAGTLREVAAMLLGDDLALDMTEVEGGSPIGRVHGLVCRPDRVRGDRSQQWFFVNHRWVKHPLLARAVEESFSGHIPPGRYPTFLLFLELDPGMVDINVHPAKKEVRLGQTQRVFSLIKDAVMRAFTRDGLSVYDGAVDDVAYAPSAFPSRPAVFAPAAAMAAYAPPSLFREAAPAYEASQGLPRELNGLRVIAQLHRTYILCEHPDGLFLLDQHNSHERWLYEQLGPVDVVSQELLMPIALTLNVTERAAAEEFQARLAELGFVVEPFGPDTWAVRAIPALLPLREAEATVRELLSRGEAVGVVSRQPDDDPLRRTIACHASVRAGDVLTHEQMEQIIERLKETRHPLTCPHGRPTGIMVSMAELNRRCLRS